jgi:glycosyltransferase involved in cell wall biosynthesis
MNKGLIIVPAFNEEAAIRQVIGQLKQDAGQWDIMVVNDASTDRTGELANGYEGVLVADLPFNLGVGGAVQTGLIYAAGHDYDLAVQFDGDGQHKAAEIDKLIAPILAGEADTTIGSRFLVPVGGFRSTWSRRMGIKVFEWLSFILIRQRITDCTSGFRAYNRNAIRFLAADYPVDYPEPEAVIFLGKKGLRMREVTVTMHERQGGSSSITFLNSPYYMIKVMLGMIMTAIR